MSIAQAAAKAMLSDALLQDAPGINRIHHLELELPLDKVIKFVSVGLPLLLVCMAFAREISLGEQLSVSILHKKKTECLDPCFVFHLLLPLITPCIHERSFFILRLSFGFAVAPCFQRRCSAVSSM